MINRTIAPEIKPIQHISFQSPEVFEIENGGKMYCIRETNDRTVRVDFTFDAGSLKAQRLVAVLTGDLLLSGTKEKTSEEIEEEIDYLGGYTSVSTSSEKSTITIFGLKENIIPLVEIVIDAIKNVIFEPKEIKLLVKERKKRMEIQLQKVKINARRTFIQELFANSRYGKQVELEDFDTLQREDLIHFHKSYYLDGFQNICVVGDLEDEQIHQINKLVSFFGYAEKSNFEFNFDYTPQKIQIEKENAVQTAIRVGRMLFNKTHPDYKKFIVVNTILGGYFGSRLMTSIREEKGYTYGIGSGVSQFSETGYFSISSEVAKEFTDLTLAAIKEEIIKLQTENVEKEELELVRNYLIGQILDQSDGAQAMMDRFNSVHYFGLDFSYYDELIKTINEITAEEIKELAVKYLNWEEFLIVTVG